MSPGYFAKAFAGRRSAAYGCGPTALSAWWRRQPMIAFIPTQRNRLPITPGSRRAGTYRPQKGDRRLPAEGGGEYWREQLPYRRNSARDGRRPQEAQEAQVKAEDPWRGFRTCRVPSDQRSVGSSRRRKAARGHGGNHGRIAARYSWRRWSTRQAGRCRQGRGCKVAQARAPQSQPAATTRHARAGC
jgi:hypothetical protein